MLTVLWVVAIATVAALGGSLAGRVAIDSARNRVHLVRARWRALGCAHRAAAAIDSTLAAAPTDAGATLAWQTLPRAADTTAAAPIDSSTCRVELEGAGSRVDVNAASDEALLRLAASAGTEDADALVERLDSARQAAPLDDDRQVRDLLGGDSALAPLLTVEHGRISLATAPAAVLVAVPGISEEIADAIVELRAAQPLSDVLEVLGHVSAAAADSLVARHPDIARLTTSEPDAWLLRAAVAAGVPPMHVVLQWRLVRAGVRARVVEFRDLS